MSHDCDCDSCQETDSRWARNRLLIKAKEIDCPKGRHISELWSSRPGNGESEYRCAACKVWVTQKGVQVYFPEVAKTPAVPLAAPQCPEHPRYQAKRKPRLPCEACWRKFIYLNP
jgi:hypothetical protein